GFTAAATASRCEPSGSPSVGLGGSGARVPPPQAAASAAHIVIGSRQDIASNPTTQRTPDVREWARSMRAAAAAAAALSLSTLAACVGDLPAEMAASSEIIGGATAPAG